MRFSANLGLLWRELALPEAVRAAARAGFDAVECHYPYDTDPAQLRAALAETGLPLLGLNTRLGDTARGEFGLAALPGEEKRARAAIDEALDYAAAVGAAKVHVLAGVTAAPGAEECLVENLVYACERAAPLGVDVLIEPLNGFDVPGYALQTTAQARRLIGRVRRSNLQLMFDCYHVQRMEGGVSEKLAALLPLIGHIQFASPPGRLAPGLGELDFDFVFARIEALGYRGPLGAEYRPEGPTEESLGWMRRYR